jgi:hypothetical protein
MPTDRQIGAARVRRRRQAAERDTVAIPEGPAPEIESPTEWVVTGQGQYLCGGQALYAKKAQHIVDAAQAEAIQNAGIPIQPFK